MRSGPLEVGRFGAERRLDAAEHWPSAGHISPLGIAFTDGHQLAKHEDSVAPGADFRSWLIGPIHRNFSDAKAALASNIEELEIERVAVDAGDSKQILRDRPAE